MKISDIGKMRITITDYLLVEKDETAAAIWRKLRDALEQIFNADELDEGRIKKCFIEATDAAIRKDTKMMVFWVDQMMFFLSPKNSQEIRREAYFDVLRYRMTTRNPLITPAYTTKLSDYENKRVIWRRK